MKKIVNQWFIDDFGVIAYLLESGEIVMPFAYGGRLCTKREFLNENKDKKVPNYEYIVSCFDEL